MVSITGLSVTPSAKHGAMKASVNSYVVIITWPLKGKYTLVCQRVTDRSDMNIFLKGELFGK